MKTRIALITVCLVALATCVARPYSGRAGQPPSLTRHRGSAAVGWLFTLTAAALNLVRLPKLLEAT